MQYGFWHHVRKDACLMIQSASNEKGQLYALLTNEQKDILMLAEEE